MFSKPLLLLASSLACGALLTPSRAEGGEAMAMRISSDAFQTGKTIPAVHTCDGADRSPPIRWEGAPDAAKGFALVVDDPDAPSGTFTHWIVYNIPPATKALTGAVPPKDTLGDGTRQGTNDFGKVGYGGPCPPPGKAHRYFFKLYALSAPLELKSGAKRDEVLKALKEKSLAEAELVGTYGR